MTPGTRIIQLRLTVTSADGGETVTRYFVDAACPGSGCGPGVVICDPER